MSDELKESGPRFFVGVFLVAVLLVIVIWIGTYWAVPCLAENFSGAKAGQFGDMFGVVAALFSGLAFAGIVVTLLMQNQELRLQRRDMNRSIAQQAYLGKVTHLTSQFNAHATLLKHHDNIIENQKLAGKDPIKHITEKYTHYAMIEVISKELDSLESPTTNTPQSTETPQGGVTHEDN